MYSAELMCDGGVWAFVTRSISLFSPQYPRRLWVEQLEGVQNGFLGVRP